MKGVDFVSEKEGLWLERAYPAGFLFLRSTTSKLIFHRVPQKYYIIDSFSLTYVKQCFYSPYSSTTVTGLIGYVLYTHIIAQNSNITCLRLEERSQLWAMLNPRGPRIKHGPSIRFRLYTLVTSEWEWARIWYGLIKATCLISKARRNTEGTNFDTFLHKGSSPYPANLWDCGCCIFTWIFDNTICLI